MARTPLQPAHALVFHGFLPWFLAKITALLGIGAKCLEFAVRSSNRWWLVGVVLSLGAAVYLACRYSTEVAIIHDVNLICRRGALKIRETTVPLWPLKLEI